GDPGDGRHPRQRHKPGRATPHERNAMKPRDLYHTGIVVDDVDATMQWLTEVAGYQWCDRFIGEHVVETPNGERTIPLHFVYSMSEPRLELLESVPGTVWEPPASGVHHLGYWS